MTRNNAGDFCRALISALAVLLIAALFLGLNEAHAATPEIHWMVSDKGAPIVCAESDDGEVCTVVPEHVAQVYVRSFCPDGRD